MCPRADGEENRAAIGKTTTVHMMLINTIVQPRFPDPCCCAELSRALHLRTKEVRHGAPEALDMQPECSRAVACTGLVGRGDWFVIS